MAEALGATLLMEVEEVGLEVTFQTLRVRHGKGPKGFGWSQIDRLVQAVVQCQPATTKKRPTIPIIELASTSSGAGKTHILYHLTALATLPVELGGQSSCVVILDTEGTLSVSRLAQQIRLLLETHDPDQLFETRLDDILIEALKHVHIFQPQSLASTIATLHSLPSYLFDEHKHYSFDRPIGFIALDSTTAFHWQVRAEQEEAKLASLTHAAHPAQPKPTNPYAALHAALASVRDIFSCPLILTATHSAPKYLHVQTGDLRAALPAPLSSLPMLRLHVERVRIRKFPLAISYEQAIREAPDRLKAVEEGRFRCSVSEFGLSEMSLRRIREEGGGFGFKILGKGLVVDSSGDEG